MSKPILQHVPTAVVSLSVVGLAFADGAYTLTARGILAVAVWWAIIIGLGLALLPFRRPTREAYITGGLLATLGALAALSIAWSLSPERSFVEFDRIALYLGIFILAVLAGTRDNLTRWTDGFAIGIAAVGLLALASRLFPALPGGDEALSRIDPQRRLAFPFGYWNALGVMLAMGLPLLLRTAVAARSLVARGLAVGVVPALSAASFLTGSRGAIGAALVGVAVLLILAQPRAGVIWAAVCAGAGSVALVAITLTVRDGLVDSTADAPALAAALGRSFAVVALAVCLLAGLAYAGGIAVARARGLSPPKPHLGAAGKAALGALAVVAVAGAVAAADPGRVLDGFKRLGFDRGERALDLVSAAGGGRYQFWSAAVAEFQAYPVAGGGAGSYEVWWAANPEFPYFVRNAHSLYLETLAELGPGGLALLLGALGYGLLTALRRLRGRTGAERVTVAALAATLLAWAFAAAIDWMWEMPLVTGVAILCLGLMTGPAAAPRAWASAPVEQATARARRGRRSFNVGVAVIAAAWLVICAQGALLLSHLRLEDSRSAAARGDFDAAAHAARGARTLQPWAGTPYRQLALIEEDRGNPDGARRFIEAAIEREPGNFELWQIAARIETAAGNTEAAQRRLERSISLNPRRRTGTATAAG